MSDEPIRWEQIAIRLGDALRESRRTIALQGQFIALLLAMLDAHEAYDADDEAGMRDALARIQEFDPVVEEMLR